VSLASRLGQLEVVLRGEAPEPDPEPPLELMAWLELLEEASAAILATMPEHRAEAVAEAFETGCWDDPIVQRVIELTRAAVPLPDPAWEAWVPRAWCHGRPRISGPLALPAATCDLLKRHPSTIFSSHTCERCGFQAGERPSSEWSPEWIDGGRVGEPRRSFVKTCPLPDCGGAVRPSGYALSRGKCIQALQDPAWGRERGIRCSHPENQCPGAAWMAAQQKPAS
jgi:hypothetical protein